MVSLAATTTTTEKKLFQLKALFLCSSVGGSAFGGVCAVLTTWIALILLTDVSSGWVWAVVFILCIFNTVAVPMSGLSVATTFPCTVTDPALPPAVPSPATVVLPPNAYELAELAVELRHVTAALAAATAEEAEGAAAAADAPPGSEPQLRQQMRQQRADMLRQRKDMLELRQTVLRTQTASVEETAPPREESPSAEVEAELARMREAAALEEKERLFNDHHTAVQDMKVECSGFRVILFYVIPLGNAVFLLCALVMGIYSYTTLREKRPSVWAEVKPLLIWVAVFWPLSMVLPLASARCFSQWMRLAEQYMTMEMEVPAEEVTVEVEGEVCDAPHKALLSEEEK